MTIAIGDSLPAATLFKVTPDGPEKVEAPGWFAGRKIVLFSVPGAFTPTCTARHLPGFVDQLDALKAKGVDEVVATAVNDAFVLSAWAQHVGADGITLLADGNGEFVTALGLNMDASAHGLGTRGQRFSMLIDDGVVQQLHVEQPGQFEVSSAEYLLDRI
jgi:peroxiredoxin